MAGVISWVTAHWPLILGTVYVLVNEAIAWSPNLKSNSVIQTILGLTAPQNK